MIHQGVMNPKKEFEKFLNRIDLETMTAIQTKGKNMR
jgi:hypothetical protein